MLKVTVVFLSVVGVTLAALALAPLQTKPKKFEGVEGCYIKSLDTVIPFGKSAPSTTSCMEYRCGKTMVKMATCGVTIAVPPCYLKEDKTKPYPDCCPIIICG